MAVKERSQIKGTSAQIEAFAGHNGVLAFATDTKSLHVLSGTAGATTEFLPSTKVATKEELGAYAKTITVNAELAKKADSASLSKVATSGVYGDLSGRPTVDTALSATSTNAVQNKVIKSALDGKLSLTGGTLTGDLHLRGLGIKIVNADDKHAILIAGGVTDFYGAQHGAALYLSGSAHGTEDGSVEAVPAGSFYLIFGKTTRHHLVGGGDGTLYYDNAPVLALASYWESENKNLWYRKYSDGWIVQGGYANGSAYPSFKEITLPIAFTSARYTIAGTGFNDNGEHHSVNVYFGSRTTTSFKVMTAINGITDAEREFMWVAYGY